MRVLLVSHDAGGTVPPMLALGQALAGRGHEVTVLGQPSMAARAEAVGCGFQAYSSIPDYERSTPLEEQVPLVVRTMASREPGDDLLAAAAACSPDVVVVDCNLSGALAAAQAGPWPSAVLLHTLYRCYTDVWFGELWPLLGGLVNDVRAGFGLAPVASWAGMFDGHRRVYSPVPACFEHLDGVAVPPHHLHAGFLVPRYDGPPEPGARVLVALSTTDLEQQRLAPLVLDALEGLGVDALFTTAGQYDGAVPANVRVAEYVPHAAVIADADAVVTHAGLGTVAVALSHGVPLVCLPVSRDQPLNAARVAALGAGVSLGVSVSDPAPVADAIQTVLSDPSYRSAATVLAEASRAAGGPTAVAADLEHLASGRPA